MLTTTLWNIFAHECNQEDDEWTNTECFSKLMEGLGKKEPDDEPLPYADIVRICGVQDALWACGTETGPEHARAWRLFIIHCAEQIDRQMSDRRSRKAIRVAKGYAQGKSTDRALETAYWMADDVFISKYRDDDEVDAAAARVAVLASSPNEKVSTCLNEAVFSTTAAAMYALGVQKGAAMKQTSIAGMLGYADENNPEALDRFWRALDAEFLRIVSESEAVSQIAAPDQTASA